MDLLNNLDNVVRLETHIRRFMFMTESKHREAEQVLTSKTGPQTYRKVLREYLNSGGTWEALSRL